MFLFDYGSDLLPYKANFICIQTITFETMFNVTSWTHVEFEKLKSLQIDNLLVLKKALLALL